MDTNINLNYIAGQLYDKLAGRFPSLEIGDETGQVLSKKTDIPKSRFYEFPYKVDGMALGTVTITLDADDGVILQLGGDIVSNRHPDVTKWIASMSDFCKRHIINFKVINLNKSNMDKRDYAFQAKPKEPIPMEPVMESKLYGTSKISYQDLGEARLVIRHNHPVNVELAAGRTQHIDSIYIENTQGERFRYPFKHLNGARALAEHVSNGGNPYDSIGQYITGLSEELAQLRKFKGYVTRNVGLSESMGAVTSRVMERIEAIKKEVGSLQRSSYYKSFAESFEASESKAVPETVMNDWVERLTIRTFNEELKSVFPYIFKLVDESDIPVKGLTPDELLEATGDAGFDRMLGKITSSPAQHDVSGDEHTHQVASAFRDEAHRLIDRSEDEWNEYSPETQDHLAKTIRGLADVSIKMREMGLIGGLEYARSIGIQDHYIEDIGEHVGIDLLDLLRRSDVSFDEAIAAPEDLFESFIHAIMEDAEDQEGVDSLFSDNPEVQAAAVDRLNELLANEMPGGPQGVNAIQSLKGIIDDPAFAQTLADVDPNLDARPIIQQYILHRQPDLLPQLEFGNGELGGGAGQGGEMPPPDMSAPPEAEIPPPEAAPPEAAGAVPPAGPEAAAGAVPPAPGAAPAAPAEVPPPTVAEGVEEDEEIEDEGLERWNAKRKFGANGARALASAKKAGSYPGKMSKLRRKFIKAWESGVQLEDIMDFGYASMTVAEAIAAAGLTPMECGYDMPEEGDTVEIADGRSGEQEILDSISGFWNREDDNFTIGGTRAKIKIKKAFANGEYQNATIDDVKAVMAKIDSADPTAGEQGAIVKLAGIQQEPEVGHMSAKITSMDNPQSTDAMASILRLLGK